MYKCDLCNRPFKKIEALNTHRLTHKEVKEGNAPKEQSPEKLFKINIQMQEGELPFVFVSVNGKAYQIKRGEEVLVPEPVVNVLKDARVDTFKYDEVPDKPGQFVKNKYTFPRYPFSSERIQ